MHSRRQFIEHSAVVAGLLTGSGLWPGSARASVQQAFETHELGAVVQVLGGNAPQESPLVQLEAPRVADNGAVVAMTLSTALTGVDRMLLLVEKNPTPLIAIFNLTDSVQASFGVPVKMAKSSPVYAVALLRDGRALFARREVQVGQGACDE